jgi:hypothetical protein
MRITKIDKEVHDKASWGVDVGQIIELDRDDGTTHPFVNVYYQDGSPYSKGEVLNLETVELEDAFKEVQEEESLNYNVSIVDNNTTIVLQKRLSVEEVHAFLKAVGA